MIAPLAPGITVTSFPRIHISLADLAGATLRRNGGIGFALSGPVVKVNVHAAAQDGIVAPAHLDAHGYDDLKQALVRLRSTVTCPPVVIEITQLPSQHIGLGTKTAVVLGALQAVSSAFGLSLGKELMQKISGRGGTSGIGIHTFFGGGFIADIGQVQNTGERYGPSSFRVPDAPALRLLGADMPEHWTCHLLLPEGHRRSGPEEVEFFESNTPILRTEALEVLATIYHGVCPGILSSDLVVLNSALRKIHSIGFKHREVLGQSQSAQQLLAKLQELPRAAAGMSSMGPLLYVLAHENDEDVLRSVKNLAAASEYLGSFRPRNSGFEMAG
jgi:beta-ribofuranosylaminobenzene 5'-phosphate synthase